MPLELSDFGSEDFQITRKTCFSLGCCPEYFAECMKCHARSETTVFIDRDDEDNEVIFLGDFLAWYSNHECLS